MNLKNYLADPPYVDYSSKNIRQYMTRLFNDKQNDLEKAGLAFHFVRDKISHSFDSQAKVITAKASDVLAQGTGICHAKSNLYAALLRPQGIPVGFCFQRITLGDDVSQGHAVHAFNAVYLNGNWTKVDTRGNKEGIRAEFTLDSSALAYPVCRPEYDEYFWEGIYPTPHLATMKMLEMSHNLQDILDNIPDNIDDKKDESFI